MRWSVDGAANFYVNDKKQGGRVSEIISTRSILFTFWLKKISTELWARWNVILRKSKTILFPIAQHGNHSQRIGDVKILCPMGAKITSRCAQSNWNDKHDRILNTLPSRKKTSVNTNHDVWWKMRYHYTPEMKQTSIMWKGKEEQTLVKAKRERSAGKIHLATF